MRYIRKNNNFVEEYRGPSMGDTWYFSNNYISYSGDVPLSRLDVVDGSVVELPEPEPIEKWVSKEEFINALYLLIPTEQLTFTLQNPDLFKTGLMGLALLTTDAAPNGLINILDYRVSLWLESFGLTIEQVIEQMESSNSIGDYNE